MDLQEFLKKCFLKGEFKLRSGQISSIYFDKYLVLSNPKILNSLCDEMINRYSFSSVDILGALEMGGIPLSTVLSLKTKKNCVYIRKQGKDYGTCKQVEGIGVSGKRVGLIEDVVTSGGQVFKGAQALREAGAKVTNVYSILFRSKNPQATLLEFKENNLKLHFLYTLEDLQQG